MNHPCDISRLINIIDGKKVMPTDCKNFENLFIKHKEVDHLNGEHIIKLKNKNLFLQKVREFISFYKYLRASISEQVSMSEYQCVNINEQVLVSRI